MTYAFRGHIFENNGAAMRINSCSYPYTFTFESSVFRGNSITVENLCDHPIDLSGAVVE